MEGLRRVLVGVELDGRDGPALADAGRLAAAVGARLTLLHAEPPVAEFGESDAERARLRRAELEAEPAARGLGPCDVQLEVGDAAQALLEAAEGAPDVDLVVVGMPQRRVDRALLRHTSEGVLSAAPCSVWLAHPDERCRGLQRILCAVGREAQASPALRVAGSLARALGASLELVSVVGAAGAVAAEEERVGELAAASDLAAAPRFVRTGSVGDALVAAAAERRADLLVLGPTSRGSLTRWLIGSTAERVCGRLGCSLLSATPRAGS